MAGLDIQPAYPITVGQLEDGHALILGTTGSGKTYQLRGMLEQLRRADRRVGAVDKLGNHWGLTLDADGEAAGLDFVIFGGKRGHVPMTPDAGEKLGRLFVERNVPAIFDVSQWTSDEQQRWVADFADAVFRTNAAPLHLALDEAQSWTPQGGGGLAFRSVQRLAEQGRGNGVRLLLSCQRLSRLDATVREMMHLVVAMRQVGALDRKAVRDLVSASADEGAAIERELPKMPTGAGFLWTSGEGGLQRVAFPENATFDSSRTPRHGDAPPPTIAASGALVEELRAALAPASAEDVPDDTIPADPEEAYRKGGVVGGMLAERDERIAELEAQLAHSEKRCIAAELLVTSTLDAAALAHADLESAASRLRDFAELPGKRACSRVELASPDGVEVIQFAAAAKRPSGAVIKVGAPLSEASGSEVRGRKALAAIAGVYPAALTEAQWATLAGYAKTGGTWGTYKGALRTAGLIEQDASGLWRATEAGCAAAGADAARIPPIGPDRARFWGERVPGARRMVDVLVKRWPHWTTRDALAADLGMAPAGGTFGTYLGRLRANALLEEKSKRIRLSADVMGAA